MPLLSINSTYTHVYAYNPLESFNQFIPIHPELTGSQGGLSSLGGLPLTTGMHHIPLMPPYVLPPATMQPCLAQGLGLTAANNELITSFKMGGTYLLTGSVTTPEASQIALLRVSLSRSLLSFFYCRAIWWQ